jgi:hypothetical protein
MTLLLVALWIAGHEFHWWWLLASLAFDAVWLSIKLNFLAVLVRRSVEQAMADMAAQVAESIEENQPPPQAGA